MCRIRTVLYSSLVWAGVGTFGVAFVPCSIRPLFWAGLGTFGVTFVPCSMRPCSGMAWAGAGTGARSRIRPVLYSFPCVGLAWGRLVSHVYRALLVSCFGLAWGSLGVVAAPCSIRPLFWTGLGTVGIAFDPCFIRSLLRAGLGGAGRRLVPSSSHGPPHIIYAIDCRIYMFSHGCISVRI